MVCEGESVKFAFIAEMDEENKRRPREERFPVIFICEMLEVSRQGYYAWKKRAPSARQKADVTLTTLIVAIHDAHKGRYGIDRIHADLARNGYPVSPKRVRLLGRAAGLECVHPRPYKATTVQDKANACGLVDLVGRDFVPAGKDELRYGDITYIFTMSGWAYLATVIDGYGGKWSAGPSLAICAKKWSSTRSPWRCGTGIPVSATSSSTRTGGASTPAGRSVTPAFPMVLYRRSGRRASVSKRCRGIVECDVQEGADPPARVEEPRACEAGSLRVYRGVLQP